MDTLTHAVLGATLARTCEPCRAARLSRGEQLGLGSLAAAFPDVDFLAFLVDPLAFLAFWHQTATHSLVVLPLWSAAIAGVFVLARGRSAAFHHASLVAALGIASHIASDAVTAFGTAVLWPLSDARIGLAIAYVVDPLFTLILVAGLAISLTTGRRLPAATALLALGGYLATLAGLQHQAVGLARGSPVLPPHGDAQLVALAQPFSPYNWKLIADGGQVYHEAHVNLVGHPPLPLPAPLATIAGAYRAPEALAWQSRDRPLAAGDAVARHWSDPRFAAFRLFARFPALSRSDTASGDCVWFTDLRYDLPSLSDTFRYGFCRDAASGAWQLYRLRYFSRDHRQRLPER
ncbi:MAG: metal-dependent hydrolase [Rhodocyclaceae bacterium]|nr:metal-dependent hydrolase [Rhodocyclaceae bacterium]